MTILEKGILEKRTFYFSAAEKGDAEKGDILLFLPKGTTCPSILAMDMKHSLLNK